MNAVTSQRIGFFLSVPNPADGLNPFITRLNDAASMDDAREDAIDAGFQSFMDARYEDSDMCYGTLYQIGQNGGLVYSECFEIYGPEAN